MSIRQPQASAAARLVAQFLQSHGARLSHAQCLDLVALAQGYKNAQHSKAQSLVNPTVQDGIEPSRGAAADSVPVPMEAISRGLAEVIEIAASKGAGSRGMPDDYVEIAYWLSKEESNRPVIYPPLNEVLQLAHQALENGKRVRNAEGGTQYQPELEDRALAAIQAYTKAAEPSKAEEERKFVVHMFFGDEAAGKWEHAMSADEVRQLLAQDSLTRTFAAEAERDAYLDGVSDGEGWNTYEAVTEEEVQSRLRELDTNGPNP